MRITRFISALGLMLAMASPVLAQVPVQPVQPLRPGVGPYYDSYYSGGRLLPYTVRIPPTYNPYHYNPFTGTWDYYAIPPTTTASQYAPYYFDWSSGQWQYAPFAYPNPNPYSNAPYYGGRPGQ